MRPFPALVVLASLAACAPAATPPTVLSSGGAPSVAETACISAVEGQTGRTGVTVRSSTATATGASLTLDVPGAAAPWTCEANQDGRIERVSYAGDASR